MSWLRDGCPESFPRRWRSWPSRTAPTRPSLSALREGIDPKTSRILRKLGLTLFLSMYVQLQGGPALNREFVPDHQAHPVLSLSLSYIHWIGNG